MGAQGGVHGGTMFLTLDSMLEIVDLVETPVLRESHTAVGEA